MFDHGDMIFYNDEHGYGEGSLGSAPAYRVGSNSESMHAYSAEKRCARMAAIASLVLFADSTYREPVVLWSSAELPG